MIDIINSPGHAVLEQQSDTKNKAQALKAHQLLDRVLSEKYAELHVIKHENCISASVVDKYKF